MIEPFVAGEFYEKDFAKLTKQIEGLFKHKLGPGALPTSRGNKTIKGALVPHAGYAYSGMAAAWAYKEIAESKMPSCFVILAPDHNGRHAFTTTTAEDWVIPSGIIKTDKGFVDKLIENIDFIKTDNIQEHSIEVQLPLLQFACRDKLKELKIVPIVVPTKQDYEQLGESIAKIDPNACIIISSDLTHFGHAYGYRPFKYNIQKSIIAQDNKAISYINNLDSKGFLNFTKRTKATICGAFPIAVGLEALKYLKAKHGRLLSYYSSGDLSGDYEHTVSYSSILFK
ncbi:MAG: AmmeMemoRadiSam system protein B [Nanoarchaeota archaeon]|nr:AmmeMemoRadiSam system protein B [Nanoarchaeota archaeon]